MVGLGVNIDHVATVRQARQTVEPDPVWAAVEAELGGADCITFHLRKDRRHINDRDAHLLKETVRGKLNMEMSMDEEIVRIALELRPDQATLVPEKRQEVTTEGGLDVIAQAERTSEVTHRLNEAGVLVSAFIDPTPSQVAAAISAGCGAVELHSGNYANAHLLTEGAEPRAREIAQTLAELRGALAEGLREGLTVHAGHGLTYTNVRAVAEIEGFDEFNIGHSIISRAVFVGLRNAVREMKELMT